MLQKPIIILTTGGTIEKSYSEFDGSLRNRTSLLKGRLLAKLRLPHTEVILKEVMAKDSLDMTEEDRKAIFEAASRHFEKACPILILHGTDTMAVTARYFQSQMPEPKMPIVFTGAMKPMGFEDSDAMQNFIEALMACRIAKPGVYVSFHNRLFSADNVKKNRRRRTFEARS